MVFEISPTSQQGLAVRFQDGAFSIQHDLALLKTDSGVYHLIDLKKEEAHPGENLIQGEALFQLMHTVANGNCKPHPSLTHLFTDSELQNLTKNSKFQFLCRLVPGLESQEHIRKTQALKRAFEAAKVLGKGLQKMEEDGYEGRFVGQNQSDHHLWMCEVLFRGGSFSSQQVEKMIVLWEEDDSTPLSLKDWVDARYAAWKNLKTNQEFLPWLTLDRWQEREKMAWSKAHPGKEFNENEFLIWKKEQEDPVLIQPKWHLRDLSGSSTETYFRIWRDDMIELMNEQWEEFKKNTGLTEVSLTDYARLDFDFILSGTTENIDRWMVKQLWQKNCENDEMSNGEDFSTFLKRLHFKRQYPTAGEIEFKVWKEKLNEALYKRYEGTHLSLSYEKWNLQQNDSIFNEPAPFIVLDDKDRKAYATTCNDGLLTRNDHPLNTEYEKTNFSGSGYAIFVIGPNEDLYCGSHNADAFQHSSFLGNAAIIAAGEVKTNAEGKIIGLSNKSGHYQPGHQQNMQLLHYFRDRGLDLSTVNFTYFVGNGFATKNAQEYLKSVK